MPIYFDNNATTPMAPEVREVYGEALALLGNASSVHRFGQEARRRVNEARESIAAQFHVPESTLVFTSGGTEAINSALLGVYLGETQKRHLVVSAVEHSAVLKCAEFLQGLGVELSFLQVDSQGRIDLEELAALIRPETALVAVMFANNEIGNVYPVKAIGELVRSRGALFFCDAVQAVGKFPIDLSHLPIDLMAASAHKFHGPKGAGLLFVREGLKLSPLHHGGRQERGRRAGTENIPAILGMAKALQLADANGFQEERKILRLRQRLQQGLAERLPEIVFHGDPEHFLPNTLNFRIAGVSGESLLMNLDLSGVAASSGAACDSGSIEPSHVLTAMGLTGQAALGGLRFSLSRYNTDAEVEEVLRVLPELVQRIRRL